MTSSITATLAASLTCSKSSVTTDPTATNPTIQMNLGKINNAAFNIGWSSTSSPDGEDAWSGQVALVAGVATIDLTNLTQTGLSVPVDATGKKVRAICVLADSGNANVIAIGVGASNGYTGIGTISALNPGNMAIHTCQGSIAVDGTHKTLDFAGTGTQKLDILIVFGG